MRDLEKALLEVNLLSGEQLAEAAALAREQHRPLPDVLVEAGFVPEASLLKVLARRNGMLTLKEVGLQRARDGVTSLEAALEVTGGE